MMLLLDSFRVVIFFLFLVTTLQFFELSWRNRNKHKEDALVQQHFAEHSIAALFAFLGSLVGTIWSVVHLFSPTQVGLIEYPFTMSIGLLLISGGLFMMHMIREQTPGHPFYIRETGEDKNDNEGSDNTDEAP